MDVPAPQDEGPPPFQPPVRQRPQWTHHGFEEDDDPCCADDDPPHPPAVSPAIPMVLNRSRLRTRGQQFLKAHELIGGTDKATLEARLKQRTEDQRDSLDVPDDELFVTKPGWVEEQDARYARDSQQAWKQMPPSEIAREGYMKMKAQHPKRAPGRSAQRKAQAEARKKKEGLYPSPNADDLKVLRNK